MKEGGGPSICRASLLSRSLDALSLSLSAVPPPHHPHPQVAFQDEDLSLSLADILGTARGRVTVAAELLCLFGMLPFLALEAGTIQALGWQWLDAWNTLDVCTYVIQVAVTTLHLGRFYTKSQLLTGLLALQCILLVLRLQYYTQAS